MILQQFANFTGHIDLALVSLYLFWAFFFWLVLYLQQETRREGYPLVGELDDKVWNQDIWMPSPKAFHTNDGRIVHAPDPSRADTRPLNVEMVAGGAGSPFVPTGNPMTDGIGPGAYAQRPDIPDTTFELKPRVVPMRADPDFSIAEQDVDPRGNPVYGLDGVVAGTITDVWVDRSDYVIRYAEVELPAAQVAEGDPAVARRVLVPWTSVRIASGRDRLFELLGIKSRADAKATFSVGEITAGQFAQIPATKAPDQVTMLEEDQIMGYVGSGRLYATPDRVEPLV